MKKPLVSIVTPSFNQAAFLEAALRSVIDQDYPEVEYLVVDGGSEDGSAGIIQKYSAHLAWWVSEKDSGQAEGINKGLQKAKGEYVAWLNSDDAYLPGAISAGVKAFLQNPDAAIVHGSLRVIDATGSLVNRIRYGDWGLAGLMEFRIIGQPAVFMRRSALEKAGYLDPGYQLLLDHQLWLRVAQQGRMVYVPEEWACARYHAGAKNVAQAASFGAEAYRILSWMQTQPGLQPTLKRNWRKCEAGAHRINARYLLDGDEPAKALSAYAKSFVAYPPTALSEWNRILFCFPAILGMKFPRKFFNQARGRLLKR